MLPAQFFSSFFFFWKQQSNLKNINKNLKNGKETVRLDEQSKTAAALVIIVVDGGVVVKPPSAPAPCTIAPYMVRAYPYPHC